MSTRTYFKPKVGQFGILMPPIGSIIAALNAGLSGAGAVAIKAGPRGLSIAFEGKVVAKGKTPEELHTAFKTAVATAKLEAEKRETKPETAN
jgi:hypothetical protein